MTRAPLLVIDGDSIGHRAYHAMPPVPDADGRPSGLLLGFANVLVATWDWVHPRAVLLALDSRERSYRHELLPGYQGQRPPFASDLTEQLDALPELAAAFGFVAAKISPFEADDLLASGVEQELAAGGSAVTMTSDRDAYQLVGERSSVLVPSKGGKPPELVGPEGVRERYGIEPSQVTDLIALRGDPSDAIPGARGIGAVERGRPAAALRHAGRRDRARVGADSEAARVRARRGRRSARLPRGRDDAPRPAGPEAARRGSRRRAGGRVGRDARAGAPCLGRLRARA